MKKTILATLALADTQVDVNAGLVTEYLNQGYTQTMNNPVSDSLELTVSYDGTNIDDDPSGAADDRLSAGIWYSF